MMPRPDEGHPLLANALPDKPGAADLGERGEHEQRQ
jgi:hypothetical protein